MHLKWYDQLATSSIYPESATVDEIAQLASDLMTARCLLCRVLDWRNLDGDGISDPLRGEVGTFLDMEEEP